jgi:hypothetical protein
MSIDPQLRTWQNSLSAQQLGKHIDKPATPFSKAFGDVKYMDGSGKFYRVYRGLTGDNKFSDKLVDRKDANKGIGRSWTWNKDVARRFATGTTVSEDFEVGGGNEHGRILHGLIHKNDLWGVDDPGSVRAHDRVGSWHPDSKKTGYNNGWWEGEPHAYSLEEEALVKGTKRPIIVTGVTDVQRKPGYEHEGDDWDDQGNLVNKAHKKGYETTNKLKFKPPKIERS